MKKVKDLFNKNKKLSIILTVILCIVLVLLIYFIVTSDSTENTVETVEDRIRNKVEAKAVTYIYVEYGVVGSGRVTSLEKVSDEEYNVYGKTRATDNYGDNYSGYLNGTCTVLDDDVNCDLEYSELLKD